MWLVGIVWRNAMYTLTKQAACWVDHAVGSKPERTPRPPRIQRWADRPLQTPSGTARAIRFEGNDAFVLVERAGRRYWLTIDSVMDEVQAKRWIKTSFWRGR
jgi:hypothetical protein